MKSMFALLVFSVAIVPCVMAMAQEPVALRVESFTVPPSTQPLVMVDVKNLLEGPYRGTLAMKGPEGWRIDPAERDVSLVAGEVKRVSFTIEKARNVAANSYPVEVSATAAGGTVVRRQNVACASAPYFKPTIDGDPSEWGDAIPLSFKTHGKQVTVCAYWNRRGLSLLVTVEEDALLAYDKEPTPAAFDAVQVAISPQGTQTGTSLDDEAVRFEFLFVSTGKETAGKCFQLAAPGMKLAKAATVRRLEPLLYDDARVAVLRKEGATYYECRLPFKPMRDAIRPSEGREFFMAVLVHDPDGTGIRDRGEAIGMWPWQRNVLAWSRFEGAQWGEQPPFDNKQYWGFCTSKY